MTDHPEHSDDDVRRLLDADAGEPSAELDADIRAAAREALASDDSGREPSGRRRWRIPAAVGAAATVLLAVVVVQQIPQPTPEVMLDTVEEPTPVKSPASRAPAVQIPQGRSKSLRATEEAALTRSAGLAREQACPESGNVLNADGIRVCVMEDHVEVHDAAGGDCRDALRLRHDGGAVSLGGTKDSLEILVDGEVVWRVRCMDGVWEIEE